MRCVTATCATQFHLILSSECDIYYSDSESINVNFKGYFMSHLIYKQKYAILDEEKKKLRKKKTNPVKLFFGKTFCIVCRSNQLFPSILIWWQSNHIQKARAHFVRGIFFSFFFLKNQNTISNYFTWHFPIEFSIVRISFVVDIVAVFHSFSSFFFINGCWHFVMTLQCVRFSFRILVWLLFVCMYFFCILTTTKKSCITHIWRFGIKLRKQATAKEKPFAE